MLKPYPQSEVIIILYNKEENIANKIYFCSTKNLQFSNLYVLLGTYLNSRLCYRYVLFGHEIFCHTKVLFSST